MNPLYSVSIATSALFQTEKHTCVHFDCKSALSTLSKNDKIKILALGYA
jgi:hypothetical protein